MPNKETLHRLYEECKEVDVDRSHELIMQADSDDEAEFIRSVTDYFLQKKQKKLVMEKKY